MRAKLCVVEGQASRPEIELLEFPLKIGRTRAADLPIAHPLISREHCEIHEIDGALVVRDNGSANGTYINDEPILEEILKPGDRLRVGPLTFVAVYQLPGELPDLHGDASDAFLDDDEDDVQVSDDDESADSVLELNFEDLAEDVSSSIRGEEYNFDDEGSSDDHLLDEAPSDPGGFKDSADGSGDSDVFSFNADSVIDDNRSESSEEYVFEDSGDGEEFEDDHAFSFGGSSVAQQRGDDNDDGGFQMPDFGGGTSGQPEATSLPEFDSEMEPVAPQQGPPGGMSAGAQDVQGFAIRLQLADAGRIEVGTPVQVAGIEVGYVYNLTWAEADGELRAEALLIVQENLGNVLREDVRVEVQDRHENPLIVIGSPGKGKLLSPDQVVLPVGFPATKQPPKPDPDAPLNPPPKRSS
ncbi:MAG: FHA domain-containing protein [Planctomycetales bacterium]